jgi:L-asparaginase
MANSSKIVIIITNSMLNRSYKDEYDDKLIDSQLKQYKNDREFVEEICENEGIDSEIIEFDHIDSSQIDLDFTLSLGKLVQRKINSNQTLSVIIIHGTDTMEITAYFLHRSIYTYSKTIILTGSSRLGSEIDHDGRGNLINSIKQAKITERFGVSINFAGKIHNPLFVNKEHSFALDPFSSSSLGILAFFYLFTLFIC